MFDPYTRAITAALKTYHRGRCGKLRRLLNATEPGTLLG
jgi:hypothetical protein